MKALLKKSMALGLLGMMIVSCAKNQEMTDQQKMQEFDFAVFEERSLKIHVLDNEDEPIKKVPLLMLEDGMPKATGWSSETGSWNITVNTYPESNLEVLVNDPNLEGEIDLGSTGSDFYLRTNSNVQYSQKTEIDSTADDDLDGVPNYLDLRPDDPAIVAVQSNYQRLMFEDIYPWKGDYDFNDVVVDFDSHFYVNAYGYVTKVSYEINPYHSGAASQNKFAFNLVGPSTNNYLNLSYDNGPQTDVTSSTVSDSITFNIYNDFGAFGEYWREFIGYADSNFYQLGFYRAITYYNPYSYDSISYSYGNLNGHFNGWGIIKTYFQRNGGNMWDLGLLSKYYGSLSTTISFNFNGPFTPQELLAYFDPYIINVDAQQSTDNTTEIHLKSFDSSFSDDSGMPYGISVPQTVEIPNESQSITDKYSNFTAWATSNGTTNQNWWE